MLEDVSVDDTARQPPSPDLYWDLGCVSTLALALCLYHQDMSKQGTGRVSLNQKFILKLTCIAREKL